MEMIKHAAFIRNLDVETISSRVYRISDGRRTVSFWGHTPDTTSLVSSVISSSKDITKKVLQNAGVNVPEGSVFEQNEEDEGWEFATAIGLPVVVKPVHGSGGRGVTSNIKEWRHFSLAWKAARDAADSPIIVEKHIHGNDYRLFVIGDQLRAAAWRVPAYIDGDGETSIEGLIESKNQSRMANPYVGAKPIKLTSMMLQYLADQDLNPDSILPSGQRLYLHLVANIGGGGESVDITEKVHADFADIAARACKAFPTSHCGIDLLCEDITRPASQQTWAICEVNICPDIAMHHFPVVGMPRDVAGDLIEHLFPGSYPLKEKFWKKAFIEITGQVTDVGFRRWLRRVADLGGLTGWVRNAAEDRVEAVLCGAPRSVENAIGLCRIGPGRAKPDNVAVSEYRGKIPPRFTIRTESAG
jgi:D-alanine-D-alanine ligase-like ATP-grasp enzyme/acylphosphatase